LERFRVRAGSSAVFTETSGRATPGERRGRRAEQRGAGGAVGSTAWRVQPAARPPCGDADGGGVGDHDGSVGVGVTVGVMLRVTLGVVETVAVAVALGVRCAEPWGLMVWCGVARDVRVAGSARLMALSGSAG
jgi:hypothetical protein